MTHQPIRTLADGVHVVEARQRFFGLEMGARMTLLELDGGLLVHSPIAMKPEDLTPLGSPKWVLAPNLLHHLYVGPWIEAGLEVYACPGLSKKRPDLTFQEEITSQQSPFGGDVKLLPLACFGLTNEVVVLHQPSRTLVVTDLVFNIPPSAPWMTRVAMRCLCGYPGCKTTLLERIGMQRDLARRELTTLLSWDFDRIVMAHGEVVETGGKEALRRAFQWLWKKKLLA
ncbi:MAG: hypothetical protein EP343_03030 [Deltaproteobacteria bacterium]|nr:MAG: hypothetical protein EP343_03030 [Deltaproteobacteria bacterium]